MPPTGAGGAAVISPPEFAQYVFTVVAAFGGTAIAVAVARRILGAGRRQPLGPGDADTADSVRRLGADLDAQRLEVSELRRELDEVHNRLDFAERVLAQAKERGLLGAPKER